MTTQAKEVSAQPGQEEMQGGQAAFALFGMMSGSWATQALFVGTDLGIADVLVDGPKTVEQLAEATETHAPSLRRLMCALASLGIFAEVAPGLYGLTPLSQALRKDSPLCMRDFILFFKRDWSWSLWNELGYAIKTGKSAMRHVHGMNIWEFVDRSPEDLRLLNVGIDQFSSLINPMILAAYDFSVFQTLADIGGGYGNFLNLLVENNPSFHGTLFERPSVIEEAKKIYSGTPLEDHLTLVPGSFFEEVPAGCDAYYYKFIINDWGDEYARQILTACRRAIPAHGKLLIAEFLVAEKPDPIAALMNIVTFLGFEGGQGRTEEEFRILLKECGFTLTRIVPTASSLYIIEGVPCQVFSPWNESATC